METNVLCALDDEELELLDSWARKQGYVTAGGRSNRKRAMKELVRRLRDEPEASARR